MIGFTITGVVKMDGRLMIETPDCVNEVDEIDWVDDVDEIDWVDDVDEIDWVLECDGVTNDIVACRSFFEIVFDLMGVLGDGVVTVCSSKSK